MIFKIFDIFRKLILHIFYPILRFVQGSFCKSSGPEIRLIMKKYFPIFLIISVISIISDILDFLLLFPRGFGTHQKVVSHTKS